MLYDQLRVIEDLFRAHEIPYYLLWGSLLGAVRHHGQIPHDDDNDIYVHEKYRDAVGELKPAFEKLGYQLDVGDSHNADDTADIESSGSYQLGNMFIPFDISVESPGTDIYFGVAKELLDPPMRIQYANFEVSIPANAHELLDRMYPGWRSKVVIDPLHMDTLAQRRSTTIELTRDVFDLPHSPAPYTTAGGQREAQRSVYIDT